jgi:hypothetical protein
MRDTPLRGVEFPYILGRINIPMVEDLGTIQGFTHGGHRSPLRLTLTHWLH